MNIFDSTFINISSIFYGGIFELTSSSNHLTLKNLFLDNINCKVNGGIFYSNSKSIIIANNLTLKNIQAEEKGGIIYAIEYNSIFF